jgi:hypothetical protein
MTMRSLALLFLLCSAACADTLVLRNGTRVTGRWWAADADLVHFLVDGHLERYARPEVSEILFGDGSAAPAPPPSAAPEPSPVTVARPTPPSEPSPVVVARPTPPQVVVPEQIGVVYFQDGQGNLVALEQMVAAGHRAPSGFTNRQPGQYWEMPGAHSSFRLRTDTALQFAVELPGGIAPASLKLYQLESKGGTRRTKVVAGRPPDIPLSVRRVAGNVYVYFVVGGLAQGEYAFSPASSNDSFCFGIDGPPAR